MNFTGQEAPRKDNTDDQLIPLINIVFLMLIFFMVAGQISEQDAQFIAPPESISEAPTDADAPRVPVETLQAVMRSIKAAGFRRITLLTQPSGEAP